MAQPRPVLVNQNSQTYTYEQVPQHTGGGTSNAVVNGGDGADPPVVDLLQIYPGKTNNLAIGRFVDENLLESQPLCCSSYDMCNIRLRNFEDFMVGLLAAICIVLFASIAVIISEVSTWLVEVYFGIYLWFITPSLSLLIGKIFVFWRFMLFRREKHTNSFEYHLHGKLFYYSFYGDTTYSLYIVSLWLILIVHWCIFDGLIEGGDTCSRVTSFEESLITATVTWLIAIPIFIYGIIGYFLVYRMGNQQSKPSDFELYYTNWAFRKYDNTNDPKYMINYHYATVKTGNEIEPSCIGNDDTCNTCDGVNRCCCWGANCCDDKIKCSILKTSAWHIVVSSGGLFFLEYFIWALSGEWHEAFIIPLFCLLCFFGVTGFHLLAGWYGCVLVNYKFKCCKVGNEATEGADIAFHDLSMKALRAYSALAALYCYGFFAYLTCFVIPLLDFLFSFEFFSTPILGAIIFIFLSLFAIGYFCLLPFQALILIDTFIKMENYKRKNTPNVVSMDMVDFRNGKNNVSTGVNNNGATDSAPANTNDKSKDGAGVVTLVQLPAV